MVEQVSGVEDYLTRTALVGRALTASLHQSEIIDIVVRQGMAGLGAEGGVLALVAPDGLVVPVATIGYSRETVAAFDPLRVEDELPLTVAARNREAVWLGSRAEAAVRFPAFVAAAATRSQAWVAIPLVTNDSVLGVLAVSFLAPREFSDSERLFFQALADQCALALAAQRGLRADARRSADGPIGSLVVRGEGGTGLEIARTLRADPRFTVRECGDHDSLADLAGDEAPDLVILAGVLPGAPLLELMGTVRTRWPHARLVVLTGDPAVEDYVRPLGADAVFGVSVPAGWLQAALSALVETARTVGQLGISSGPPPAAAPSAPRTSLDALALSSTIFESSLDAVLFTAPDGQILAANPAACGMLGMSQEEICRRGRSGLADPADPRWISGLQERNATGRFFGELSMVRGDGSAFPAEVSSAVFENADGAPRTVVVFRDVSDRKEAEELLKRRACADELTGALNRRGFFDVAPELLRSAQESGDVTTLLFADVDGLKDLNDNRGFGTGDAALREVADLLREACRADDLVARFGGDEFVVLSRQRTGETGATLARRVENRFHLRNARAQPFPLRVSVGEAQLAADGAVTIDHALVEAHRAMREGRIRTRGSRSRTRAR